MRRKARNYSLPLRQGAFLLITQISGELRITKTPAIALERNYLSELGYSIWKSASGWDVMHHFYKQNSPAYKHLPPTAYCLSQLKQRTYLIWLNSVEIYFNSGAFAGILEILRRKKICVMSRLHHCLSAVRNGASLKRRLMLLADFFRLRNS